MGDISGKACYMRLATLALTLTICLTLSACVGSLHSQQPPAKWTTGFWFWDNYGRNTESDETVDVLFCLVGYIRGPMGRIQTSWNAYASLPDHLPNAREYWVVYRYEKQGVPDPAAAPVIAREVIKIFASAKERRLNVAGVQFDIDSPTGSLPQYANFIREVKKALPTGTQISITALLDWFRDGSAVGDVIAEVDEFVPQFYDVFDPQDYSRGSAIAKKIDALEWAPKFNRFRKRFRIGISTFGRARLLPSQNQQGRYLGVSIFRDLTPLDIGMNPAFGLQTTRSEAGEIVLTYTVTRRVKIDYHEFEIGDQVQFILATPESVQSALHSAKRMTGNFAGVVFFRWPAVNETLGMKPQAVLVAAGQAAPGRQQTTVRAVKGHCAAVHCVDLFLENLNPLAPSYPAYHIRSSVPLEYFLPEPNAPVALSNPNELTVALPPFADRPQLYLGRAVTSTAADFSVREQP
jgi:hypothetical protein